MFKVDDREEMPSEWRNRAQDRAHRAETWVLPDQEQPSLSVTRFVERRI